MIRLQEMKIKLSVSDEDHAQLLSGLVADVLDPDFTDVTLVCGDGQLKINRLALALLLPPCYHNLHLGEASFRS